MGTQVGSTASVVPNTPDRKRPFCASSDPAQSWRPRGLRGSRRPMPQPRMQSRKRARNAQRAVVLLHGRRPVCSAHRNTQPETGWAGLVRHPRCYTRFEWQTRPCGDDAPEVVIAHQRLVGEQDQHGVRGASDRSGTCRNGRAYAVRKKWVVDEVASARCCCVVNVAPVVAENEHRMAIADRLGGHDGPPDQRLSIQLRRLFRTPEALRAAGGKDHGKQSGLGHRGLLTKVDLRVSAPHPGVRKRCFSHGL